MARVCIICNVPFYYASEVDPPEDCWCGEGAWGTLWAWDRWRAWRMFLRYRTAQWLFDVGTWLAG